LFCAGIDSADWVETFGDGWLWASKSGDVRWAGDGFGGETGRWAHSSRSASRRTPVVAFVPDRYEVSKYEHRALLSSESSTAENL
jgi:hypothetical protein